MNPDIFHRLQGLDIHSNEDLLKHFPKRYEDRRILKHFLDLITQTEENYPVLATVEKHDYFNTKKGKILKIVVHDGQSPASLICFHRDYLAQSLLPGEQYILFGSFQYKYGEIQAHSFEFIEKDKASDSLHFLRIVPIYPLTQGVKQDGLRSLIYNTLSKHQIHESLPPNILKKRQLISKQEAFWGIHFPKDEKHLNQSQRYIKYYELFELELNVALKKALFNRAHKKHYSQRSKLRDSILDSLPYALTSHQKQALTDIEQDLHSPLPMHRMLQGDVGSGKTIVALLSMIHAVDNGYQAVLMCPREILAKQHHKTFSQILEHFPVRSVVIAGSLPQTHKRELYYLIRQGFYHIIIGTQSLFSQGIEYKDLGLVVIDEQHKFGVQDRIKLIQKGTMPDILLMSATPIPRTLALTIYGDLDMSILREKPQRPSTLKSYIIIGQEKRQQMYQFINKELEKGRQGFVVCPAIEESSKLQSAESLFLELQQKLPKRLIGLLHSKLSSKDKHTLMHKFVKGHYNLLVSTSIIEVGIDIANATIMVVEQADRFGLPQLHQLRGRIGRGTHHSHCFFYVDQVLTENTKLRLKALRKYNDGFRLAEEDLKLRGPGEFLGTRQTGLAPLKLADLTKDEALLHNAKEDAFELVDKDPTLNHDEHKPLKALILQDFLDSHQFYLRT